MSELLDYTILGIVVGAIYAVAASGLVVTYVTSGVFNVAHGAVGMLMAFTYWELRFNRGVPAPLALLLVVGVIAPLCGIGLELVLIRRLRDAPLVTRLVVTVGLMVGFMGLANIIWPPTVRRFPAFFAGKRIHIADVFVSWHRLIIVAVAVAVAVALRLFLYHTRPGVSTRAVVDSPELAQLNGGRPGRASALGWALGASSAALAGILLAPLLSLSVEPLTLLVLNAYAAAVVGRLRSLPWTFAGALVLGLLQTYAISYVPTTVTWLTGLRPAIPVLMLFVVLLALPSAPLRGFVATRSREIVPKPSPRAIALGGVALVAVVAAIAPTLSRVDRGNLGLGLVFGIVILSLVPLTGYAGQISLAQMTFAGLGAVAMAKVGADGAPVGLLAAAALAAGVGALVALPALRLQGLYVALATLSFAVLCEQMVFPQRRVLWQGNVRVGRLDLPGVSFDSDRAYLVLLATVFALLAVGVVGLRRGSAGRRLLAMKDSPAACSTLGMNLTRTRLEVFALSAAIAGLGGALYGGLREAVGPNDFKMLASLPLLLMGVVGGIASVGGALAGGMLLVAFPVIGHAAPSISRFLVVGPALVGIGLGRDPNGAVAQTVASVREAAAGRIARRSGVLVPEHVGTDGPVTSEDRAVLDRTLALEGVLCDVAS